MYKTNQILNPGDAKDYHVEDGRITSVLHLQADTKSRRQSSLSPDLTLVLSLTFLTALIFVITSFLLPKPLLENHQMCGLTTGGQDECYFKCGMVDCVTFWDVLVKDLSCLSDCFLTKPGKCVTSLLNDVASKGVCNVTRPDGYDAGPGVYQENNECEMEFTFEFGEFPKIIHGTCSNETEALLVTDECVRVIYEQPEFIANTITGIIGLSCRYPLNYFYLRFGIQNNLVSGRDAINYRKNRRQRKTKKRIAPVQWYLEEPDIKVELQYNNTRHRYPWVCSLRSKGPSPVHRCAVNLLSIPPNPTVIVGAAHCTYICKDGSREVPVCCCSDSTDACKESNPKCGDNPGVVEMTGDDASILCGEWDTSQASSLTSGEKYNVELPILEIIRHPGFDPAKGTINGNDLAVFKVQDRSIQNNKAEALQLWPACLPSEKGERPLTGIHTGWSTPPPFSFIQSQAEGYARFYNDFYKQWHYKMDIFDTCEDPTLSSLCGTILRFPTNSSYPAGTVCAKDFLRQSCFSTGDSGSPLMVKDEFDPDRFNIEGILSFVKGCSQFQIGLENRYSNKTTWLLKQATENPTAYTKLSCFLPWVAAQYNMRYETTGPQAQACSIGSDVEDNQPCRNTISNQQELIRGQEIECKFPFFYDGRKYNECILFIQDDFLYPIFRCPILDITTKINGTNSYEPASLLKGYCLSDPDDDLSALDPTKDDCNPLRRRVPFSQCKNNCPGVRAFGIIGGGTVLAGVATVGVLGSFTPWLGAGALGAVGVGGMMIAGNMCAPPFFCRLQSGKCCPVVNVGVFGPQCPDDC